MSWREQLQPASFKGVEFHVDDSNISGFGRRIRTFEYPFKDKPYTQEFGKSVKRYTFSAFVIGEDYISHLNGLLAALESAGSGELIHPQIGSDIVFCEPDSSVTHSKEYGGMAELSLTFIEAGELTQPSSGLNAAQSLGALIASFSSFSIASFTEVFNIGKSFSHIQNDVSSYLSSLGVSVQEPAISGGLVSVVRQQKNIRQSMIIRQPVLSVSVAQRQIEEQKAAIDEVINTIFLSQELTKSIQSVFTSVKDIDLYKSKTLAIIDDFESVSSFESIEILREIKPVWQKLLNDIATNQKKIDTYIPLSTMAGLNIAYYLYQDSGREKQITEINNIKHPGFIDKELLVLSE